MTVRQTGLATFLEETPKNSRQTYTTCQTRRPRALDVKTVSADNNRRARTWARHTPQCAANNSLAAVTEIDLAIQPCPATHLPSIPDNTAPTLSNFKRVPNPLVVL